jgi:flagellar biosynthesis protein FlhG
MQTIIPVASGKGGVGKTFLTANLGIAIAQHGHSTIVVDLDFGNSSLHAFLGLPNSIPGIGDFLRSQAKSLEPFRAATEIQDLEYIAGEGLMPLMADITHHQKQKIIKEICTLEVDYILLDLGAGCRNDILDLFGIADRGILVTMPERPSMLSTLIFIKNYLLRKIDRLGNKDLDIIPILQEIYNQPTDGPGRNIQVYRDKIAETSPEIALEIDAICRLTRPRFIYNMGEHPRDLNILPGIDNILKSVLLLEGDHLGCLFSAPEVRASVRAGKPLLLEYPESLTAKNITQIATRIIEAWNIDITDSAKHLRKYTAELYEKMGSGEKLHKP